MDISFYVLLTVACLVLLFAMWVCAASNTPKWGPDLTLELPPHIIHQVLFATPTSTDKRTDRVTEEERTSTKRKLKRQAPSAPSELPSDPLLSNEHPSGMSNAPPTYYRPPVLLNMDTAVQVLPCHYMPSRNLKPVFSTFTTEEPA